MAQDSRSWTMAHLPALRHAADLLAQPTFGSHQSLLLRVLSELSSNPSVKIRAITAALYSGVVPHISPESVKLSILPVLAALHTDPDANVRRETCFVFVSILRCFPHDKDLCERTSSALDMLSQDQNAIVRTAVCQAFLRESAQFNSVSFFAHISKKLCGIAQTIHSVDKNADKNGLGLATWQAISAFQSFLTAAESATTAPILTALKLILSDTPSLNAQDKQSIESLIQLLDTTANNLGVAEVPTTKTPGGFLLLIKKK